VKSIRHDDDRRRVVVFNGVVESEEARFIRTAANDNIESVFVGVLSLTADLGLGERCLIAILV
jgi:hypothetical protein